MLISRVTETFAGPIGSSQNVRVKFFPAPRCTFTRSKRLRASKSGWEYSCVGGQEGEVEPRSDQIPFGVRGVDASVPQWQDRSRQR